MKNKQMLKRLLLLTLIATTAWYIPTGTAWSQTPEEAPNQITARDEAHSDMEQIIDLLEEKGIITQEEAAAIKRRRTTSETTGEEAETGAAELAAQEKDDSGLQKEIDRLEERLQRALDHVQTDSRLNKREIERLERQRIDELQEKNRKSAWAQRVSLNGDLRLRYQKDFFDSENGDFLKPDAPDQVLNSKVDRERFRARARLGMKAKILDPREVNTGKMAAALRITTGSTDDPVSTNESLGDYFNKDSIVFDRYYLNYAYEPLLPVWGRIPQIALSVGRMPNPWFSSDLVWDSDLNFEGVSLNFKTDTLQENGWHIFLTGGAYPLQEVELSSSDKYLYGGQIGFFITPKYGFEFTVGAGYYDYKNMTGEPNDISEPGLKDYTAPEFQQKGNTLFDIDPSEDILTALASDYNIIDLTAKMDISYFFPIHIILDGSYVKNIGFDKADVGDRVGEESVPEETEGYRIGLKVGYPTIYNFKEWNFFFEYKYLEADAVLDAFTDSDFHGGGTNAKGWIAGLAFGLYRNVWLHTRWITTDEISGPQFAMDTFQFDINARF